MLQLCFIIYFVSYEQKYFSIFEKKNRMKYIQIDCIISAPNYNVEAIAALQSLSTRQACGSFGRTSAIWGLVRISVGELDSFYRTSGF